MRSQRDRGSLPCPQCGYDLRAAAKLGGARASRVLRACPECGGEFDDRHIRLAMGRRVAGPIRLWTLLLGLLLVNAVELIIMVALRSEGTYEAMMTTAFVATLAFAVKLLGSILGSWFAYSRTWKLVFNAHGVLAAVYYFVAAELWF